MHSFRLFLGLVLCALLIGTAAMAQPMSGTYTIGDGIEDNYASFTAAITDLMTNGVEGAVIFDVEELVYREQVGIGGVTGASAENTITFRDIGTPDVRPLIKWGASTSSGVLILQGASYVTFDGIDVQDTVNGTVVRLSVGCWFNTFKNLTITGNNVTSLSVQGVYFTGSSGQNGNNLFDHVTFNQCGYALYNHGSSSNRDQNLEVRYCTINGCKYGLWIYDSNNARLHDNDITVGWVGCTTELCGVRITQLRAGDSCFVYNNKIHGMQTTNASKGIQMAGSGMPTFVAYNNMIYDFTQTGMYTTYGIECQGATSYLYNNTIFVSQVGSSGDKAGILIGGAYTPAAYVKNNIIVMGQTNTSANYGIYKTSQGTLLECDNNCFYSIGGGTGYKMGRYTSTNYATLALWQAGTGLDLNSVEGNPGFMSAVAPYDLHINADSGLVHLRGAPLDVITTDIDGDVRWTMPDMGADEYTYNAPTADYWVRGLLGWDWLTPELTALTTDAIVVNRGSANQTNVPVIFYYDGIPQDTEYVTLDAYTADTVTFNWTSPAQPDTILLEAQSFLVGDAIPDNDSATASVAIIALPMAGTYTIGASRTDYTTFGAAIADLTLRGISAAVIFEVEPETYNEAVVIPAAMTPAQNGIRGASATNTITFRPAPSHLDTPPEIVSATTPALNISTADYITFDGIDIAVTIAGKAVQITGNADYNTIKNCALTGAAESGTGNYGIHITGGGNDYNVIDNVTVDHTIYYPVYLAGASGTRDEANEVRNCTLIGGRYGVTLNYQNGAKVHDCDIQPGYDAVGAEVIGIYNYTQTSGELSMAYNNKIHNIRGNNITNGIYSVPGTGGQFLAYNNFIYDYQVTGTSVLYGLRVASGTSQFISNSVYIGDVGTSGTVYGYYQTGSTTYGHVKNNVFRIDEPTNTCYALYRNSTTGYLYTDYNTFYSEGPGAAYNLGYYSGAYASLWFWNRALGFDAHSYDGNPGFVSATDLHIQPHYSLLNGVGLDTAAIVTDIDGNGRGTPPDIGADEYAFAPMAHDYGVVWIDTQYVFVGTVPRVIQVVVKNFGSNAETDVPVALYYNGALQNTVTKSLASGAADTVNIGWTPSNPVPPADQEIGTLVVKTLCPSDTFAQNDSLKHPVSVRSAPLSGTYDVGGGAMDYATFGAAATAASLRGIASEVIFDVYAGNYVENVVVNPIPGTSYTDRVIFRKHLNDVVTIAPTVKLPLRITGGDYITFDGINIQSGVAGPADTMVTVRGDADYVTLMNMTITGNSNSFPCCGVKVFHDGNDNFLADNLTVSTVSYGIGTWNTGSGTCQNFEVRNCHVTNSAYCIMYDGAYNARVHDNDLEPSAGYGIYISSAPAGDTTRVYNNRIHNLVNSSGIFATVSSVALIYNNFMWDWHTTGTAIAALMPSVGTTHWYYNTVYMDDQPGTADGGKKSFYYRSTGTAYVMNNIFVSAEDADTVNCYDGITGLTADYNCFYDATGANPNFQLSPGYATLPEWQATINDLHSLVGNPGLISATDLHIDTLITLVDSAGTPIAEVTDDIDGNVRNAAFPDMGADEFNGLYAPSDVDSLTVFPDVDAGDVLLRWAPATGANSYKIYAGSTFDFVLDGTTYVGATGSTNYTHVGILNTGSLMFYVVVASTDLPARLR